MKALNLKSVAILASILVLSAGFTACSDEPDMPGAPSQANVEGLGAPAVPSNGNDAPCTIWWTVDEGVEAVTVNGKIYAGQGSIKAKVGDVIRWEATAKPAYQFSSPEHDSFRVEPGAEGGVINIPITTQRGNI